MRRKRFESVVERIGDELEKTPSLELNVSRVKWKFAC